MPSCAGGRHLTEAEVERLMEAAKGNRWRLRDSAMILVAYRHGLRVSELVDLRWARVRQAGSAVRRRGPRSYPLSAAPS
jgi:site-specific recombinase XerD